MHDDSFAHTQRAQEGALLDAAFDAIRRYQKQLPERRAVPSPDDLKALDALDEPLAETGTDPVAVFEQLATLGETTTVPSTGGRLGCSKPR